MGVPPGVVGDGMVRLSWITTFNGTSLTAVAATAGVDLSCYMTSDGFNRQVNEQVVTDDRLCTVQSGEEPGRYMETLDLKYIWDQQNLTPSDNLAYTTLKRGTKGFLVVRYAMPFTGAFAAEQIVDVIAGTAGVQKRTPVAANEKLKTDQKLFIPSGGVVYDLELT